MILTCVGAGPTWPTAWSWGGGGGGGGGSGGLGAGAGGGGGSGFGPAGATLESDVQPGDGLVTVTYDPADGGCEAPAGEGPIAAEPAFTG